VCSFAVQSGSYLWDYTTDSLGAGQLAPNRKLQKIAGKAVFISYLARNLVILQYQWDFKLASFGLWWAPSL
jgi:hypothetical protein